MLDFARSCVRCTKPHVIEVLARDGGGRIIADREPHLRAVRRVQVVRCSRTSHFCRHPAGLKSIREDIRPVPCDREG